MSRPALWESTAPVDRGGRGAPPAPTKPPTGATRGISPATPGIPSPATVPAQGATGRDVCAVLARVAGLHEQLSQATRELEALVENNENGLAGVPDSRLSADVETPTPLLTAKDLAARLQVDARTIRRWRKAGKIPPGIELGRSVIRWPADQIERWLAEGGCA